MTQAKNTIEKLIAHAKRRLVVTIVGWSLGLALPITCFVAMLGWLPLAASIWLGLGLFCAFLLFQLWRQKNAWPTSERVLKHLDRAFPVMQESAALLVQHPESLSQLQQAQQQHLSAQLQQLPFPQLLPVTKWRVAKKQFLIGAGLAVLFSLLSPFVPHGLGLNQLSDLAKTILPGSIQAEFENTHVWQIKIQPPAYTRLEAQSSTQPGLTVAQGSAVHWELNFPKSVKNLVVHNRPGESFELGNGKTFQWNQQLNQSGYYYLEYQSGKQAVKSDYFPLEIQPDQAPSIVVNQPLETRTEILPGGAKIFPLELEVGDDYGVAGGELVVTVAKGTGESVKFREKKMALSGWSEKPGTQQTLHATLTFSDWEAEPGDELYFYAQVWDNRHPEPNYTRSDTFFAVLLGGEEPMALDTEGILVKPVRAYFRSMRQIIIDTEKLLSQSDEISAAEFRRRSENLGVDQKVLRLRYGQFLGEEFESSIGAEGHTEEEANHHGHDHHDDHDHEHEHEDAKGGESDIPEDLHAHDHGPPESGIVEDTVVLNQNIKDLLPAGLLHDHDDAETASFFDPKMKLQLKEALSEMWSSELFLRTVEPGRSLPYQYRALKMIKELQQMSRVYEQKAGIETPPLEPEKKRLTGEHEKMASLRQIQTFQPETKEAVLRQFWQALQQPNAAIDERLLAQTKPLLESAALKEPGKYVKTLEAVDQLENRSEECGNCRAVLSETVWQLLPQIVPEPKRREQPNAPLGQRYFEKMGQDR